MLKFEKLRRSDVEQVLRWRVQPDVSRYMLTDIEFDLHKQKQWFERIQADESQKYWIIRFSDRPIGLINLAEINPRHRRCSIGYYIGEKEHRPMGFMIPPYLYNHVFNRLGLHKITGEVLDGNAAVLKMHQMHGWRHVGTMKDQIFKYDRFHDLHIVELLSEDWKRLAPKYGRFVTGFEG